MDEEFDDFDFGGEEEDTEIMGEDWDFEESTEDIEFEEDDFDTEDDFSIADTSDFGTEDESDFEGEETIEDIDELTNMIKDSLSETLAEIEGDFDEDFGEDAELDDSDFERYSDEEELEDIGNEDMASITIINSGEHDEEMQTFEEANAELFEDAEDTEDFDDVIDDGIFDENGEIVVMDKEGEAFEFQYLPIKDILIPDRIRKKVNTSALEKSIQSTGLLKPIVVARTATDNVYVLLDGYKRMYACGKVGLKEIACIINNKVKTTEISILEALYNHYTSYSVKERVDYIDYLENEKNIRNQNTIEYLLQMDPGDYPKLKDILNDGDGDIIDPLMTGKFSIEQAYNKLKAKRAKQTKEEKELEKASRVYEQEDSGVSEIENSGDVGSEPLNEEEIAELGLAVKDDEIEEASLEELMEEGNSIGGYEPNQQQVGKREFLDPELRKAVLARDQGCVCCGLKGNLYSNSMDIHHVVRVADGGSDALENLITTDILCHSLIHQWSAGTLHIGDIEKLDGAEREKFKKIVAYGNHIRKVAKKTGKKAEELKKEAMHAGRNMPGGPQKVD